MSKQAINLNYPADLINIGATANDRNGDPLRTAFTKINDAIDRIDSNFSELYNAATLVVSSTAPDTPIVGSLWYDTISGTLYIYYDSNWVDSNPPPAVPTDISDLTDTTNLLGSGGGTTLPSQTTHEGKYLTTDGSALSWAEPSALINGANSATLDSVGSLTFINGREIRTNIVDGIELYRSSDNTIGLYTSGARIKAFATGNPKYTWDFANTGILTLPGNSYLETTNVDLKVGSQGTVTIRSNAESSETTRSWEFGRQGTIATPLLLPKTFTAVLDNAHRTIGDAISGTPWQFTVAFVVGLGGAVETQMNNPFPNPDNPGYVSGDEYEFAEEDHGIPGFTFAITLNDVVLPGGAGWTANPSVTPAPEYPSTVGSLGAIKLSANTSDWVFDPSGTLHYPDGSFGSTAFVGIAEQVVGGGYTAQVGSTQTIADDGNGGLVGWGTNALAVAYDANIISTYPVGSTITFQDGTTATITQWDDYGPTYIDLFWDTPKTGTLFPITLKTDNYVAAAENTASISVTPHAGGSAKQWLFETNGNLTLPGTGTINNPADGAIGSIYTFNTDYMGASSANDAGAYLADTVNSQNIAIGWVVTFSDNSTKTVTAVTRVPSTYVHIEWSGSIAYTYPFTVQSADYAVTVNALELTPDGTTTWTFGTNGGLTFPDATVQTTAYTGSISTLSNSTYSVSLSSSGTLTLPTSPNTTTTWTSPTDFPGWGSGYNGSGCVLNGGGSVTGRISIQLSDPVKIAAWLALPTGTQVTVSGTGVLPSPSTLDLTGVSGQDGLFYYQEFSTAGVFYQDGVSSIGSVSFTIAGTGFSVTPSAITFPDTTVQATAYTGTAATATSASTAASVGYIGMPQNSKSANYELVIGDMGKHVYVTATSTVTIPAYTSVDFPIGTTIAVVAGTGATVSIAITTDTMNLAGPGTTGTRTLAPFGMATLVKVAQSTWFISGVGLT